MFAHLPMLDGAAVNDTLTQGGIPSVPEYRLPTRVRKLRRLRLGTSPGE